MKWILWAMAMIAVPAMAKTVLVPIPHYGFDPTESAVPWKALKAVGFQVVFATPDGQVAAADRRMLTGEGLPTLFKNGLMAAPEAVDAYGEMAASDEFQHPIAYAQIRSEDYAALLLPGGHDKGMREYLESRELQRATGEFFAAGKPVAAICHGTVLAGRSPSLTEPARSVLWGRKTTGLTRNMEMLAYQMTRLWLGDYYRTYPITVQDEVTSYLQNPADFSVGPGPVPLQRDTEDDRSAGYTVRDGNYLSARWPGDAHKFTRDFVNMIHAEKSGENQ